MKKVLLLIILTLLISFYTNAQSDTSSKNVDTNSIQSNNPEFKEPQAAETFWEKIPSELYVAIYGLIISIITSIITVSLSTKKFRTENWWQLKNQTYSKIIEALHHMKTFFSENFDDELELRSLTDLQRKELSKKWKKGYEVLSMEVDKGSFIISNKASEILNDSMKKLNDNSDNPNWVEYLDTGYGIIIDCLKNIRIEAKRDLKVK